jgi:hypothetical protein
LIIVSDGAPRIKNYAEDAYEKATSVLDYYHAAEYLHRFKDEVFNDKEAGKKWGRRTKWVIVGRRGTNSIQEYRKNSRRKQYNCGKAAAPSPITIHPTLTGWITKPTKPWVWAS